VATSVRASLAPDGAVVVEATTDPYARPMVESVMVVCGGDIGHVRSPSPTRREEDYI
jgi:hypothetical protein